MGSVCIKAAGNKIFTYVEYIRANNSNIIDAKTREADICIEFASSLVLSYEDYKKVNLISDLQDYIEKQRFLDLVIRPAIASARGARLTKFDVDNLVIEFTDVKKTEVVHVRVTPDEKRKLEEEARKHGITISDYIRYKLFGERE